jgi:hypothetical protein
MLKKMGASAFGPHRCPGRIAILLALAVAALSTSTACEDKAIGRPCQLKGEIAMDQGAYTVEASDCPSRICVKPAVQGGITSDPGTGPYCSAECDSNDDCSGQTRDPSNPDDNRCARGFVCAPVFNKGKLCCTKICLCRDFFSASVGPTIPDECKPDSDLTCS